MQNKIPSTNYETFHAENCNWSKDSKILPWTYVKIFLITQNSNDKAFETVWTAMYAKPLYKDFDLNTKKQMYKDIRNIIIRQIN